MQFRSALLQRISVQFNIVCKQTFKCHPHTFLPRSDLETLTKLCTLHTEKWTFYLKTVVVPARTEPRRLIKDDDFRKDEVRGRAECPTAVTKLVFKVCELQRGGPCEEFRLFFSVWCKLYRVHSTYPYVSLLLLLPFPDFMTFESL